jgi:hypothetical protein
MLLRNLVAPVRRCALSAFVGQFTWPGSDLKSLLAPRERSGRTGQRRKCASRNCGFRLITGRAQVRARSQYRHSITTCSETALKPDVIGRFPPKFLTSQECQRCRHPRQANISRMTIFNALALHVSARRTSARGKSILIISSRVLDRQERYSAANSMATLLRSDPQPPRRRR